jgi:hypothetical protein
MEWVEDHCGPRKDASNTLKVKLLNPAILWLR